MKFNVMIVGVSHGTIDVTDDVYENDTALINVLVNAGHIDRGESFDIVQYDENQLDIFEGESNEHRVSLVLLD